ncbi:DUF6274 family protein [Streptomyces sp. NPDC058382]|uniref:DUF6274 family protein n=1 Tax=unclassified Streptomyces TaxID=2593676 RepID=UPI003628312A
MTASTDEGFRPDGASTREPARPRLRRSAPRREIRALLRAHLAAATGYRHLTRHCAVCARLLRLAMEPVTASPATGPVEESSAPAGPPEAPSGPREADVRAPVARAGGESPPGGAGAVHEGRPGARPAEDESPPAA